MDNWFSPCIRRKSSTMQLAQLAILRLETRLNGVKNISRAVSPQTSHPIFLEKRRLNRILTRKILCVDLIVLVHFRLFLHDNWKCFRSVCIPFVWYPVVKRTLRVITVLIPNCLCHFYILRRGTKLTYATQKPFRDLTSVFFFGSCNMIT